MVEEPMTIDDGGTAGKKRKRWRSSQLAIAGYRGLTQPR
jgi:hypothetical protein